MMNLFDFYSLMISSFGLKSYKISDADAMAATVSTFIPSL